MNYNGIVKDIAELISFDMSRNNIQDILAEFEKVMVKYNIETYDTEGQKTDMRHLCETMLKDSFNNNMSSHFLFGPE